MFRLARNAAFVLPLLFAPSTLLGQGKGGLLGGFNFSELVASPQDYAQRIGNAGGFNLSGRVKGRLRLVVEGYWSEKGADGTTISPQDTVAGRTVFNYAEFPIQFRVSGGEEVRIFLNGGVAGAIRLKCSVTLYYASGIVPTDECNGATGRQLIKSADYSWVFGGGFAMKFLFLSPSVEVRVIDGFAPIGGAAGPNALRARNRVISTLFRMNVPCWGTDRAGNKVMTC